MSSETSSDSDNDPPITAAVAFSRPQVVTGGQTRQATDGVVQPQPQRVVPVVAADDEEFIFEDEGMLFIS